MYKTKPIMTGGCQCGALRYALFEMPEFDDLPLPDVPEGSRRPVRRAL